MDAIDPRLMLLMLGVLIGIIIGYVARRNHFCTLNALERHWFASDSRSLRAWVLAAAIALFCTTVLQVTGFVDLSGSFYLTSPVPLGGAIIGGVMFGIGMALVGTCGFGAIVRLGGGNMRALVVLTGIALAAIAAQRGVTGHFRQFFIDPLSFDLTQIGAPWPGTFFAISSGFSISLVAAILLVSAFVAWIARDRAFFTDREKLTSGTVIGVCVAVSWLITYKLSTISFDPLQVEAASFIAPIGDTIFQLITVTGAWPDYGVGLAVGVFLGAAFAAWHTDDMRWEACDDARELGRHLAGAFLMGTGGVFALGCTIGQGVSAVSALAVSAPVAMASIVFGARIGLGWLIEGSAFGFLRRSEKSSTPAE